jgi:hypothetical protein
MQRPRSTSPVPRNHCRAGAAALSASLALSGAFACGPQGTIEGEHSPPFDEVASALLLSVTTATASSVEGAGLEAAKAVDGSLGTRWSSQFSDPQWLQVDLGSSQPIDRVVIDWEAAYAKAYQIQVSKDAVTWTTVRSVTAGDGGTDDLTALGGTGRYVRMYGTARATVYGYSIWEMAVYSPATSTTVALPAHLEAEKPARFFDTTADNSGDASCSTSDLDAQITADPKGGVCNVAYAVAGEWIEFDVSVATTASFDITARLAANTTGKSVHVAIDGANVSGTLTAPSAGWQTFADVVARNVSIAAGTHKLRVAMDTGSTNVNYIDVKAAGSATCTPACSGKTCGSDGCGGTCGTCTSGTTCGSAGTCVSPNTSSGCKRGEAYGFNSANDLTQLSKRMTWWYNWALTPDSGANSVYQSLGVEFVPMQWGGNVDVNGAISKIPQGAKTLLTFNEPNFFSQSNLSPTQAAALWPKIQQIANARSLKISTPAVNYCGGGCWETNPYTYMDKFFAACTNCQIDYVAVHWYACTLSALQNYINGFKKYGKPIWLTEFSCGDGDTSLANQKAYMQAAVPWLESEPSVMRYAWFSGRTTAIPNVNLLGADGQLTELGQLYESLTTNSACGR